jgi:putative PIN family toxin of toxin-antitoxin system
MQLFIVDTNVLVSGLISNAPQSPTVQIVNAMLKGELLFVISQDLLIEYQQVLLRDRIRKLHGLNVIEIDTILAHVVGNGIWVEVTQKSTEAAPDPNDQHLWALLNQHPHSVLITGDRLLLDAKHPQGTVISPSQYQIDTGG